MFKDYSEAIIEMKYENRAADSIFMYLALNCDRINHIRISIAKLCEFTKFSDKHVRNGIKYLIKNGWIERIKDPGQLVYTYILNPCVVWSRDADDAWMAGFTYSQADRYPERNSTYSVKAHYIKENI